VLISLALGLVEGIVKTAFPAFPLVEVVGFHTAIASVYLTVKTYNNVNGVSEENGREKPD
jgi:hypothetical protein